ncbi:MAG: chitobiase/beta-hexosaminidase C-terminal domain-containing protein, partial [Prevotella sp.]|nr:chitobiase/beta-hexosaminidase C-terminal domain-containing protein [Prevotella sp.]
QAMIAEAKGSLTPTPSPTGEGSQSGSNSGSQNSGNSGNSGSQSQQNSVAAPTISGVNPFEETSQVSISGPDGATIYYSENGDDPDSNDTLYTQPFTVDETTTIKAIAIKDGVSSQVTTKVFTKGTGGSGGFETGS